MSDHAKRLATHPWRRWYWTNRWRKIAKDQLQREPLCRMCLAGGIITAATVCDHVERHQGDEHRFYNGPMQSLCANCHDGTKQRQEHGREPQQLDDEGWPTSPIGRPPGRGQDRTRR